MFDFFDSGKEGHNAESHVTAPKPTVSATATFEEKMAQIDQNLDEARRIREESEAKQKAIDEWLSQQLRER
jgi:hypothetical protein